MSIKQLDFKHDENQNIVVYGTGYASKILINFLLSCKNIQVDFIMVSPGHKEAENYQLTNKYGAIIEIPIIEFGNESFDKGNTNVYLTLIVGKEEVQAKLKQSGYSNLYDIQPIDYYEEEFFKHYLQNNKVDLTKEILHFRSTQLYNPIMYNPDLKKAFYETLGDELAPGLFNDNSLIVDGSYEYGGVFLSKGDYVIDAGANIGSYACYAAQKGCTVYACEPGSRSIEILEKQKTLYDEHIHILPIGLADHTGYIDFYESDSCALDSIYMPRGDTKKRTIKIDTIDNLVANGTIKHVDYIKADIEGAERYMLQGARKTLLEMAPKLSICTYHYKEDPVLLEQIITEANPNYIVEHHWRKLYAYVP